MRFRADVTSEELLVNQNELANVVCLPTQPSTVIPIKTMGTGRACARVHHIKDHIVPDNIRLDSQREIAREQQLLEEVIAEFTQDIREQKLEHQASLKENELKVIKNLQDELDRVLSVAELRGFLLSLQEHSEMFCIYDFYFKLEAGLHFYDTQSGVAESTEQDFLLITNDNLKDVKDFLHERLEYVKKEELEKAVRLEDVMNLIVLGPLRTMEQVIESGHTAAYAVYSVMEDSIAKGKATLESSLHDHSDAKDIELTNKILATFNDGLKMRGRIVKRLLGVSDMQPDYPILAVGENLSFSDLAPFYKEGSLKGFSSTGLIDRDHAVLVYRSKMPIGKFLESSTTDVVDQLKVLKDGQWVVLDNQAGQLVTNPSRELIEEVLEEMELGKPEVNWKNILPHRARTKGPDSSEFELMANLNLLDDLPEALARFAGIGLVRTESLLAGLDRADTSWAKQFSLFRSLFEGVENARADRARSLPVTVRIQDYSTADKQELVKGGTYIDHVMPGLDERQLATHVNAILAAALNSDGYKDLTILWPCIERKQRMLGHVQVIKSELPFSSSLSAGELFAQLKIGAQIESVQGVRNIAAVLEIPEVRNITVGTNDLVASLQRKQRGPGVKIIDEDLRLLYCLEKIQSAVSEANARRPEPSQVSLKVCGDIASDPLWTPVLVGLGYESHSIAVEAGDLVSSRFSDFSVAETRNLISQLINIPQSLGIGLSMENIERIAVKFREVLENFA